MIIIAGPCQCESLEHSLLMADRIARVADKLDCGIYFKASFDKANRTSGRTPRGAGLRTTMTSFDAVRAQTGLRCTTDIHEPHQAKIVADYVDLIQIPALLSRQTDLIEAAAATGRKVNIKRGQFMAPDDMKHAVAKARDAGADRIYATERGYTFGYNDLVVDMRSFPVMARAGADFVIHDATHCVQTPGSLSGSTGGRREMIEPLARAAIAAGADGIFVETHQDPDNAPSDGPVMLPVDQLYDFLARMRDLHAFVKGL